MICLTVDGKEIQAEEGKTLLQVCLDNGIYIPNLCYMEGMENPPTSCRLCFVEIAGEAAPVASCRVEPRDGMVVGTDSPEVRRLQRSALRLLLSAHRLDCKHCPSNRRCELQRMTRFLSVPFKRKRLDYIIPEASADFNHPLFDYDPGRCVLCGRCIHVCEQQHGYSLLTFAGRGIETLISSFGAETSPNHSCSSCLACLEICPVSAITLKEQGDMTGTE